MLEELPSIWAGFHLWLVVMAVNDWKAIPAVIARPLTRLRVTESSKRMCTDWSDIWTLFTILASKLLNTLLGSLVNLETNDSSCNLASSFLALIWYSFSNFWALIKRRSCSESYSSVLQSIGEAKTKMSSRWMSTGSEVSVVHGISIETFPIWPAFTSIGRSNWDYLKGDGQSSRLVTLIRFWELYIWADWSFLDLVLLTNASAFNSRSVNWTVPAQKEKDTRQSDVFSCMESIHVNRIFAPPNRRTRGARPRCEKWWMTYR